MGEQDRKPYRACVGRPMSINTEITIEPHDIAFGPSTVAGEVNVDEVFEFITQVDNLAQSWPLTLKLAAYFDEQREIYRKMHSEPVATRGIGAEALRAASELPRMPPEPPPPVATLVTIEHLRDGVKFLTQSFCGPEEIKIGSLMSNHVCLRDDGAVSRLHATIEALPDGRVRILDLGTVSGTFVNGQKARLETLRSGDVVAIGSARLRVTFAPAAPASDHPTGRHA